MSYLYLWRIEDHESSARYIRGQGICAGDDSVKFHLYPTNSRFENRLRQQFELHEDWGNTKKTGLISAFNDRGMALGEAERRLRAGHQGVVVWTIEILDGRTFMRPAKEVADHLGCGWPDKADSWIDNEILFAHCIEERWIRGYRKYSLGHGQLYCEWRSL